MLPTPGLLCVASALSLELGGSEEFWALLLRAPPLKFSCIPRGSPFHLTLFPQVWRFISGCYMFGLASLPTLNPRTIEASGNCLREIQSGSDPQAEGKDSSDASEEMTEANMELLAPSLSLSPSLPFGDKVFLCSSSLPPTQDNLASSFQVLECASKPNFKMWVCGILLGMETKALHTLVKESITDFLSDLRVANVCCCF